MPSYYEKEMYNKWIEEWGFTHNQIQDACKATTSGTPTMAYLDGILRRMFQTGSSETLSVQNKRLRFGREIFAALGRTGITPSEEDQRRIADWIQGGFSEDMIMMAAQEAHTTHMGGNLDDIENKLRTWRENHFASVEEITLARTKIMIQNEQMRSVYKELGKPDKRIGIADRDYFNKWTAEMGMSMELILQAAKYARESGAISIKLVNKILSDWQRAGISTLEGARAEHESHVRGAGTQAPAAVRAQDTMLRYTPEERRATYSAAELDLDEEDS